MSLHEAEMDRINMVISTLLENEVLTPPVAFPAVVVAAMERAAQYHDMNGPQKRALVEAVVHEITRSRAPGFAPFLPLVATLCDTMVHAARNEFVFRHAGAGCLPCCHRR